MQRVCTALLALGACQPPSDPEGWRGENLEYFASPGLEVCGGTHRQLDDFVSFFAAELGLPIPPGITYTWLDDISGTNCPVGAEGCARGTKTFSLLPFHPHELVHAVATPNRVGTWPFFSEGLATAYDPFKGESVGPRYLGVPNEGEPLSDPRPSFIESPDRSTPSSAQLFYATAGSFVAFLLSRHGPGPFVAMTQHLPEQRDLDVLRKVFSEHYPTDLDTEVDLFMRGADCPTDPFPTLVFDCTMPEVAWETATNWRYHRAIDCADDDVGGGFQPGAAFRSVHSVTLEVPTSGTYSLHVSGDPDLRIQLGACFGCPWERRGAWAGTDVEMDAEPYALDLDAGPYFLRIVGASGAPANIEVELRRQ